MKHTASIPTTASVISNFWGGGCEIAIVAWSFNLFALWGRKCMVLLGKPRQVHKTLWKGESLVKIPEGGWGVNFIAAVPW